MSVFNDSIDIYIIRLHFEWIIIYYNIDENEISVR